MNNHVYSVQGSLNHPVDKSFIHKECFNIHGWVNHLGMS